MVGDDIMMIFDNSIMTAKPEWETKHEKEEESQTIYDEINEGVEELVPESKNNVEAEKMSVKDKFTFDVIKSCTYYKSYRECKFRERKNRIHALMTSVLAICSNKKALNEKKNDYLIKNRDLAVDCLMIIDLVKDLIQEKLQVNMADISDEVTPAPQEEHDNESKNNMRLSSAVAMLCETSSKGYERMREKFIEEFQISKEYLPSYYNLTKSRPKPIKFVIFPATDIYCNSDSDFLQDIDNIHNSAQQETANHYGSSLQVSDTVMAAKLEGGYDFCLKELMKKHEKNGVHVRDEIAVIDCFDGAEHIQLDEGKINILSYNTQLFFSQTISVASTSSSFNILTWMQVLGEEKCANIFPVMIPHYREKVS